MRIMYLLRADGMPLIVIKATSAKIAEQQLLDSMNDEAAEHTKKTLTVDRLTLELLDKVTEGGDFEDEFSIVPNADF